MNKSPNFLERRKDIRTPVANGIVALPKTSTIAIGIILDISKGGLGVRYTDSIGETEKNFEIDILLTDNSYYITKLSVTTISDYELANVIPFSRINERRCGLKFCHLSEHQSSQLDDLITNHAARIS
jgi:c-di-GMP-binding flagellar brake protein YcgR